MKAMYNSKLQAAFWNVWFRSDFENVVCLESNAPHSTLTLTQYGTGFCIVLV